MLSLAFLVPNSEELHPHAVEVELLPPPPNLQHKDGKKEKQIVRQALVPDKLKAPDDETLAKYLSEQRQRVRQETQASHNGMTANRANQILKSQQQMKIQQQQQQQQVQQKQEATDKDGYRTVDVSKELNQMRQLNQGMSSVGETLDVKVGSFTALNTDRYLYYTFYARIEELVRFRWENRVESAINNLDKMTMMGAARHNWVTDVEFLLDRQGVLRNAIIMKESGMQSFDAAAVNAFKDAHIFPNPPQEMVQDDGFIHLKFSFDVNYNPPAFVNSN
jgi:TonB family protein